MAKKRKAQLLSYGAVARLPDCEMRPVRHPVRKGLPAPPLASKGLVRGSAKQTLETTWTTTGQPLETNR